MAKRLETWSGVSRFINVLIHGDCTRRFYNAWLFIKLFVRFSDITPLPVVL